DEMRAPLLDAKVFDMELRARERRLRRADLAASGQEDGEKEGKRDVETARWGAGGKESMRYFICHISYAIFHMPYEISHMKYDYTSEFCFDPYKMYLLRSSFFTMSVSILRT